MPTVLFIIMPSDWNLLTCDSALSACTDHFPRLRERTGFGSRTSKTPYGSPLLLPGISGSSSSRGYVDVPSIFESEKEKAAGSKDEFQAADQQSKPAESWIEQDPQTYQPAGEGPTIVQEKEMCRPTEACAIIPSPITEEEKERVDEWTQIINDLNDAEEWQKCVEKMMMLSPGSIVSLPKSAPNGFPLKCFARLKDVAWEWEGQSQPLIGVKSLDPDPDDVW